MSKLPATERMYRALVDRDSKFEGVFFVGVTSTGILCRPTCPARKPKPENIIYFETARDGLLAGFRPCLRCRPMAAFGTPPPWLDPLMAELESDPDRRWRDADLRARDLDPTRVRRWFKQHHGMTFHGYQRARRLGRALGQMQSGDAQTKTAFEAGYNSLSGFREAFQNLFGASPGKATHTRRVLVTRLTTPLGPMLACADEAGLCLLEFVDRRQLETQILGLRRRWPALFAPGHNEIIDQTKHELDRYFAGKLKAFSVPLHLPGTEFQTRVWTELQRIPYGTTRSYSEQAAALDAPRAVRAVARANGDNRIAIIVPCHRVIGRNGQLTGYGGQIWRKRALLDLEHKSARMGKPTAYLT